MDPLSFFVGLTVGGLSVGFMVFGFEPFTKWARATLKKIREGPQE